MDDTMKLDLDRLLATATSFLRDGIEPPRDKALTCEWSSSPTTGRLESHWVNKPELPEIVTNGIL